MTATAGDFIGNYRILVPLSSHLSAELYLVEHTLQGGPPLILLRWPMIELVNAGDRQLFLQKAEEGNIQRGVQSIFILHAGLDDTHPYLVTRYTPGIEATLNAHLSFVQQIFQSTDRLHPDQPHIHTETFLRIFLGLTPQNIQTTDPHIPSPRSSKRTSTTDTLKSSKDQPPKVAQKRLKLWRRVALAIIILAILFWATVALYLIILASR